MFAHESAAEEVPAGQVGEYQEGDFIWDTLWMYVLGKGLVSEVDRGTHCNYVDEEQRIYALFDANETGAG